MSNFFARLFGTEPEPLSATDAQIAMAAMLVRVAKSNGKYVIEEIQRIDRILEARFHLNQVEAAQLRAKGEELEHDAPDTVRFTRAIKDSVALEDRLAVIESLWQVALADGTRDPEEDALLRMVAPMLGLTDPQNAQARKRAEDAVR